MIIPAVLTRDLVNQCVRTLTPTMLILILVGTIAIFAAAIPYSKFKKNN